MDRPSVTTLARLFAKKLEQDINNDDDFYEVVRQDPNSETCASYNYTDAHGVMLDALAELSLNRVKIDESTIDLINNAWAYARQNRFFKEPNHKHIIVDPEASITRIEAFVGYSTDEDDPTWIHATVVADDLDTCLDALVIVANRQNFEDWLVLDIN
jgi:uncharacterized protein YigE (DUF2233 family)